jgi:hypothetical protein
LLGERERIAATKKSLAAPWRCPVKKKRCSLFRTS